MTPNRRELLQLLGASSALYAVGCGDGGGESVAAVLDPDEDSLAVAVWSERRGRVRAVVRAGDAEVRAQTFELDGPAGLVEIDGLAADTAYEIALAIDGAPLAPLRARTAPAADARRRVRLAVAADYDPHISFASGMTDALIAAAPELVISLGDFPYTDNGPIAQTVAEYRARHLDMRAHPPVRTLLESAALCAIYDDHEFRNNWDARFVAREPARYAAAMQVWDEFFPVRPRRAGGGEIRYRSWRWGAHVECFLLDCRRFRGDNIAPDSDEKSMLGQPQRRWLLDGIARSTAAFKLVLTSVPLDFGHGDDHWSGYRRERDAMFAELIGIPGVLFVSADQHWFASHRHAHGIREIQIGPLARGIGDPPPAVPGVLFRAARYNAGLFEFADDGLTILGLGEDGEVFYRETVSAAELTPMPSATALAPRSR